MASLIFPGTPGLVPPSQATCVDLSWTSHWDLQKASQNDSPVARPAEVDAHVVLRRVTSWRNSYFRGVGDSGGPGSPTNSPGRKDFDQDGAWDNRESGWAPEVPELHPACLRGWRGGGSRPISAGLGEQWLAEGSSVTGALPAHKSAFVPWGGGGGRPDLGRCREESSPAHPRGRRNSRCPQGHCVHPGKDGRQSRLLSAGHSTGPPRPCLPGP